MTLLTKRVCKMALVAGLMAVFSSCAGRIERPGIPSVLVDPPPADQTNGTYTLETFNADFKNYSDAAKSPTPTEADKAAATFYRNKMVYGLIAEIDYVYHNYETTLFMDQGSFKVAGDVLQLGLSTASTITNGARAKTVLSAALTGVSGVNLSIDKNFFRQQTVQALMSSMQAARDEIKTTILKRLGEDASKYPFQAARSDLTAYFFAGTLPTALQKLHQTAAADATTAKTQLQRQALKGVTAQQIKNATDINVAVHKAIEDKQVAKVVTYLTLMGHPPADTDKMTLLTEAGNVGDDVTDRPELEAQQLEAARKAGLIP